jgi:hypothetical protein
MVQKCEPISDQEAFFKTILNACLQVGCPVPLNAREILFEFHKKYYSGLSLAEIKQAFEMHTTGDLVDEKGESAKHFQQFSCEFYATVLKRYRTHRDRVIFAANKLLQQVQQSRTDEGKEQREKEAGIEILKRIIEDFSAKESDMFGAVKYDLLRETGIIPADTYEQFTKQAMEKIKNEALRDKNTKSIAQITSGGLQDDVRVVAKRIAYGEFLKENSNLEKVKKAIS